MLLVKPDRLKLVIYSGDFVARFFHLLRQLDGNLHVVIRGIKVGEQCIYSFALCLICCLELFEKIVVLRTDYHFDSPFCFNLLLLIYAANEEHNPQGLTPNINLKTALTPVGVDAVVTQGV